jgi:hypothetical protein
MNAVLKKKTVGKKRENSFNFLDKFCLTNKDKSFMLMNFALKYECCL